MLNIATKKYKELEVSDIELNQNKNLTTLEAFHKIEEAYKDIEKSYIIGADNLYKMILSPDFDTLMQNYKYIVIQRGILDCEELIKSNVTLQSNRKNIQIMENLKHNNTSATEVRKRILDGNKDIENILQKEVLDYIEQNRLYIK